MASLILSLSLLLIGSKYYLSEIFFGLFLLLENQNRIYNWIFYILVFLVIIIFKDLRQAVILTFLLSTLFLNKAVGLRLGLLANVIKINVFYGYVLYFASFVFGEATASYFLDLGLYGVERTSGSKGIAEYVYNGVGFPRFYAFTAEPSIYCLFTIFILFVFYKSGNLKRYFGKKGLLLIYISIVLSMSISGIFSLIIFFLWQYRKRLRVIFKFTLFIFALIYLSFFVEHLGFINRSFNRFFDILNGNDASAFIRLVASFGSVIQFFLSSEFYLLITGLNELQVVSFLESLSFSFEGDDSVVEYSGTNGNSVSIILLNFGLIGMLYMVFNFARLSGLDQRIFYLGFLIIISFTMSLGFVAYLVALRFLLSNKVRI